MSKNQAEELPKCLNRWIESQGLYCQLQAGHVGEHWAKYKHESETEPSGEIWWTAEQGQWVKW